MSNVFSLAPVLKQKFTDSDGEPLSGGKIYSYHAGTSTPLATYTDESGDTPNTNPVVLDSTGSANVWLGAGAYKFVVTDSMGTTQFTVDDVVQSGSTFSILLPDQVTGVLDIPHGGTGADDQQDAINALTGTQSAGKYLRSDGTNATLSTIQAADVPTLNQSTTGTAANITGVAAIAHGGTNNGSLGVVAGGALYTDGTKIVNIGAGVSGQVFTSGGSSPPSWMTSAAAGYDSSVVASNLGLAASVSSNALTIALKQKDGSTDPSSASPVGVGFRNATATVGGYSVVSQQAALSITVPSGATLGQLSVFTQYVWVYLINDAGIMDIGLSGGTIFKDTQLVTPTKITSGATSYNTLYSANTHTSACSIRLVGKYTVAEITAGAWATAPSEVDLFPQPNYGTIVFNGTQTSQALTANTTNLALTTFVDTAGGWGGSTYTALFPGHYGVTGGSSQSSGSSYALYKNGSALVTAGVAGGSFDGIVSAFAAGCVPGDVLSIRTKGSITITAGNFSIFRVGD